MEISFTIAIPTYRRPDLATRAVESALAQTHPVLEILVHDNSPDDETERALFRFPRERVQYRRHDRNLGLAGNWNSLIQSARGEYVKFLNDDDILHPTVLETASPLLSRWSPGVATCRARYVTSSGEPLKEDAHTGRQGSYYVRAQDAPFLWFRGALPVRTPTHSFYRTDLARELGGFAIDQDYTRDIFLALRLASAAGAVFLEEAPLVDFLIHPGQDGKKVAFSTRTQDQYGVKRWAFENRGGHAAAEADVEAEQSAILLREMALMARARRWNDLGHGMRELLSMRKSRINGSLLLARRDLLKRMHAAQYKRYRHYQP